MTVTQKTSEHFVKLLDVLSKAAIGNFSDNVSIPKKDTELTPVYVGVQIMLEVIRGKILELNKEKKSLQADKSQLETLIDTLPVGVYIADAHSGKPIIVNKKAVELVGRPFKPEAGYRKYTKTYDVITEDGKKYPVNKHPLFITLKKKIEAEKSDIVIQRPDKSRITLKVRSVPVFDVEGNMISAIAVMDDITRERELDRVKSEFISLVSHQLRTPLGNIRWNLELLLGKETKFSKDHKQKLNDIYESTIRLIELVNDILSVSNIEADTYLSLPKKVDVVKIVKSSISEFKQLAFQKNVEIKFRYEKVRKIFMDEKRFYQVMQNLISNAMNYNNKNGWILISVEQKDSYITISVKDSGIGIPARDKNKIFTKFFRSENALKSHVQGTGLGLYIVKVFIEKIKGNITFKSIEGKGTEFILEIPVKNKKGIAIN